MKHADTIIVGAGIVGLSLAYELASAGQKVRVLDRHQAGKGASSAAAGILPAVCRSGNEHDDFERLRTLSWKMYPEWIDRIRGDSSIDPEYQATGGLHIATSRGEMVSLKVAASQWQADGLDVQPILSADELATHEPVLQSSFERGHVHGGYFLPDECLVRPPMLLRALLEANRKKGVALEEGVEVQEWVRGTDDGGRIVSLRTSAGEFAADQFCIASGAWSSQLGQELGLRFEIEPWRGQMVLFRSQPGLIRSVINEGPNYLVPRVDGHVLAGSTVEEVGFDQSNTEEAIGQLIQFAESLIPDLNRSAVRQTWAGLRPGSGDGVPLIGRTNAYENLFLSTGHFRSGVFLAPATSTFLSQLMLGETPGLNLEMFDPNRN